MIFIIIIIFFSNFIVSRLNDQSHITMGTNHKAL